MRIAHARARERMAAPRHRGARFLRKVEIAGRESVPERKEANAGFSAATGLFSEL